MAGNGLVHVSTNSTVFPIIPSRRNVLGDRLLCIRAPMRVKSQTYSVKAMSANTGHSQEQQQQPESSSDKKGPLSVISHRWNQTVQVLHQIGIPDSKISEFIFKSPTIMDINPKKMIEVGLRLEKMGFDVTSPAYRAAFTLMCKVSHSVLDEKFETYRSMGFTDAQILNIFRTQPSCMFLSEKTIRALVTFYRDKLHISLSYLSQRPYFLLRSLERRIIPRCSVMQVLWSKGIISKPGKLGSLIAYKEKDFLERYVIKYEAEVPELQAAYLDRLVCKEYTFHLREFQSDLKIRKPVEKVK